MAQSPSLSPTTNQSDEADEVEEGRLLDGFLLLAAGGSSTPEDVVSANLASLQIVDVADEDLTFFVHLDRVDVSDNRLSHEHVLQQFGRLPRLSSLALACNSISSLQVPPGILRHLQSLDLSYNGLHGDVLSQLSSLRGLVTLNFASNCVSSLPPEADVSGFQALEELILDNNDLVQFVQWRALDAMPRLRKLSLASNRIKRLKDDMLDADGDAIQYMPSLQELDLSSNEITSCSKLPVLQLMPNLQRVYLSNNPCMKATGGAAQRIPGVEVIAEQRKKWYLTGSGCHQGKPKVVEPKLKLDRKKLRKVRSQPHVPAFRSRGMPQLCIYDEEANQLLVALKSVPGLALRPSSGPDDRGRQVALERPGALSAPPVTGEVLLSDDLSEDELDQILNERRANIDRAFREPVEEPTSFIRSTPFATSASQLANQKLARINGAGEPVAPEAPSPMERGSGAMGRQPSGPSFFSLTGLGDDAADLIRSAAARPRGASTAVPMQADSPSAAQQPQAQQPPAAPSAVKLPPIGSSRSSSACSTGRVAAPPMPNVG
eukprot:CAMPEP_0176168694 /NCGR_PEP_ID=MMETSP0120_2-20121206/86340_1 /TAXON_ID=160619 /ORGANISM="Kryptoperidinium foliaceum, Strain CCMP 1326" /LENGTH=546 /DNA_ID=CAMNT_0017506413 /DNA_START=3 /DNA_END=1639 /DNA_ORIENTATION=+